MEWGKKQITPNLEWSLAYLLDPKFEGRWGQYGPSYFPSKSKMKNLKCPKWALEPPFTVSKYSKS